MAKKKETNKTTGFTTKGKLVCPGKLDLEAQKLWDRVRSVMPDGVLQSIDAFALFGLCQNWSLWISWKQATQDAMKRGDMNEAYKNSCIQGNIWKAVENGCAKFGMTPKDRQAFKNVSDEQSADLLADFLKRANLN